MQKRLFIAISYDNNPILAFLQQRIMMQLQAFITDNNGTLTLQKHVHNTIFFLGNRPQKDIGAIQNECALDIEKHIQKFGLGSLLSYSSRIHFQILGHCVIAAVLESNEILSNLYALFEHSFGKNHEQEQRSFLPHITLARIKKLTKSNDDEIIRESTMLLKKLGEEFQEPIYLSADALILFSSNQSHYTEIAKFSL